MVHLRTRVFLLGFILLLGGCGYHLAGEGSEPRPGVRSVAIPVFENNTSEPELETLFAGALRREFMLRSRTPVVSVTDADAVFEGRIISARTNSVSHSSFENSIENRIYVVVGIRCVDAESREILWQDNSLAFFEEYFQSDDPIVGFENRRQALDIIAREVAVRVYDRFMSNF